jgi:hypothetical protein
MMARMMVAVAAMGTAAVLQGPTVLRIVTGPQGAEVNGSYKLDEERTRFDPATDKQVVVLFEWQGTAGAHRLAVKWSSPDGAVSTSSAIDYMARDRRFGAYWALPLSGSMAAGLWSVEATVDGQPGGRATFELAPMPMRAPVAARRPLSSADAYARLNTAVLVLDRQTSTGKHLEPAVALATGPGRVVTSVAALDGADVVDAVGADGSRQRIDSALGLNRRQDWAVLAVSGDSDPALRLASGDSIKVGDRCFSIEGTPAGGRVLVEGGITGQLNGGASGPRYIVQWANGTGIPGAPVINEYGELIGIVGGAMVSGVSSLGDLLRYRAPLRGVPVIPASLLRWTPGAPPRPLAEARATGDLLPAIRGDEHVVAGGFAKRLIRTETVSPSEIAQEFTAADKMLVAFISWGPQTRVKGAVTLRVIDENNHVIAESKPKKMDVRQGSRTLTSWDLPVPSLPGWYRGEFLLDGVPIYRAFMRVEP